MSTHINAKSGDIAKTVLLPGDPLRAKFIAENFLQNSVCYNQVRGMFGFTGFYKGKKVSVQGTGMGQPSLSIYATELFCDFGVENAIRIGTCGGIQKETKLKTTILATAACSDSAILTQRFGFLHFAPTASFDLLLLANQKAKELKVDCLKGVCASSDLFYDKNQNYKLWAKYNVLGIEMETAELYTLAALYSKKALSILTVSDNIITGQQTTAQERQETFTNMMQLALEVATNI